MKNVALFLLLIMLASCQNEDLTVIENIDDNTAVAALGVNLRDLVQQVTTHDGSFDNVVDESSCFSIKFPYVCFFNGEPYGVTSEFDLLVFTEYDELVPEFPVTIVFGDHTEVTVENEQEFNAWILQCSSGTLPQEFIACVDLVYPFNVAVYDPNTTDFETLTMDSDKRVYESIETLTGETLISMNFPIDVQLHNGNFVSITSNEALQTQIISAISNCN